MAGGYATKAPRALFVSPHLDDAVFSCGERIGAATPCAAVTLFAGRPPAGAALTPWDGECGFAAGQDVVGLRRDEDRRALAALDARAIWLDFRDDQYGESRGLADIVNALANVIEREAPESVYFPLGLFHRDHRRASDAALALVDRFPATAWYAYEDAIYRRIDGHSRERRGAIAQSGFVLDALAFPENGQAAPLKRAAVGCYRSQLRGLRTRSAHDDVFAPETYWRVTRRKQRS